MNYAEDMGKYRGETPWKLVKPFKHVDATEHPYLTQDEAIRLQNACRLLRETAMPIADIAARSGFTTPEYFHRVFRKQTGETPHKYRHNAATA